MTVKFLMSTGWWYGPTRNEKTIKVEKCSPQLLLCQKFWNKHFDDHEKRDQKFYSFFEGNAPDDVKETLMEVLSQLNE